MNPLAQPRTLDSPDGSLGYLESLRAERDAAVDLRTMAELTQLIDEETARIGMAQARRRVPAPWDS
jgi:hypothetical protein